MPPFVDNLLESYSSPQLEQGFGEPVVLKHGQSATEAFTATWENVVYEVVSSEGFATQFAGRDWTFAVGAATAGGRAFEPRAGDRIVGIEQGVPVEFELLPVSNLPAAELMPGGFRWKVRTKRIV